MKLPPIVGNICLSNFSLAKRKIKDDFPTPGRPKHTKEYLHSFSGTLFFLETELLSDVIAQ